MLQPETVKVRCTIRYEAPANERPKSFTYPHLALTADDEAIYALALAFNDLQAGVIGDVLKYEVADLYMPQ